MNAVGKTNMAAQTELDELAVRLTQITDKNHQGDAFRLESNLTLYLLGLVIPIVLMWIGWYW